MWILFITHYHLLSYIVDCVDNVYKGVVYKSKLGVVSKSKLGFRVVSKSKLGVVYECILGVVSKSKHNNYFKYLLSIIQISIIN